MNTRQPQVLVIDDEPDIRELLTMTLERMSVASSAAANVAEATQLLDSGRFDLCLTDMNLPDGNGMEIIRHIQRQHAGMPVAVITAHGSMEAAVDALKAGAFDFVSKPLKLDDLRNIVTTALKVSGRDTASPAKKNGNSRELLGDSKPMQRIRAMVGKLARSQAPVYISGESGTGKELVARLIHEQGPRANAPFIAVNCGAIPAELMESELFGHQKGSFTGAHSDKEGLFQAANGGTLFLDEVADLPKDMQVKLLRAIQEKAIRPVGGRQELRVDVRFLSATHKDLANMVDNGDFRQDLFYRLNVIEINVPPLRERVGDIALLAEFFLTALCERMQISPVDIEPEALDYLLTYSFPGNVRELENVLERALTLCDENTISTADLVLRETTNNSANSASFSPGAEGLDDYVERVEREAIQSALERTKGNKTAAAKLMGISFRSLRYKLDKLGLD